MLKKLFRKLVHSFWHDELAAKRWLKGILLAILPIFIQIMLVDTWMTWSPKEWFYHLLPSVLAFIYGSLQGAPKVLPPPATPPSA